MPEVAAATSTQSVPAAPPPATTSTPAATSGQVSPGKLHPKPLPNSTITTRVAYDTSGDRPSRMAKQAAARTAAAAAPAKVAPAPAAAATTASAAEASPAPAPEAGADQAASAADSVAAEPVAVEGVDVAPAGEVAPLLETSAAKDEEPKLSNSEFAKRMGKLAAAEGKVAEGKQALAAERRAFAAERAEHAQALARVKEMDRAKEIVKTDAVGFMHRVFGLTPQQLVDQMVERGNKKPEVLAKESEDAREARIAALEKQLEDGAKQTKEQQQRAQAQQFVKDNIAPIVSDTTRFRFLNAEFGADAAATVYNTMASRFNKTGKTPPPHEVAEFIENELRTKAAIAAQLLSSSAATPQTANPKKVETPPASKKPVSAQQAPAVPMRRPRLQGKPYTSQVR